MCTCIFFIFALQASKRRTLNASERHQQLVERNYNKRLQVEALKKIENQIRNQIVQNENDDRAERKRLLRLLQNEQFELDMEEAIQKVSLTIHSYIIFFPSFSPWK